MIREERPSSGAVVGHWSSLYLSGTDSISHNDSRATCSPDVGFGRDHDPAAPAPAKSMEQKAWPAPPK